ncbi:MAG: TadE/TadG family type IV pilus assembly protein [Methylophilaceae bacterium]|jgi:uncharacterized protein (UPF0333 family)|nr:pilus assembly protein [Methylophilales bacterium]
MKLTNHHLLSFKKGQSLVEFAILLPLLLILALGVVDFSRAIQFNNILVAMSREGANLAARSSESHPNIIRALINTASPLTMSNSGQIYITRIVGTLINGKVSPIVQTQTRAVNGGNNLPSKIWTCPNSFSSTDGTCTKPSGGWANATATLLNLTLSDGEEVYAVETLYNYDVIMNYVMQSGPQLYSLTIL